MIPYNLALFGHLSKQLATRTEAGAAPPWRYLRTGLLARHHTPDDTMSLTLSDVTRIAQLARIDLSHDEAEATLGQLNGIFALIEQLRSVDTTDIEPLSTPLAVTGAVALRLRDDAVTESDHRARYQTAAPATAEGLYLVPRVLD